VHADGERLVAVVADGAGSSARAAEGARMACAAVLELATAGKGEPDLGGFRRDEGLRWLQVVRERLQAAATAEQVDWQAFSCTLLVALVDAQRAVFLQIGDGAIVYRAADGRFVPALWPQTGEYANTTWFVTDETACERLQAAAASDVHELALFSDGLQSLALRFVSREVHAPFFEPMFERLRQEAAGDAPELERQLRLFLDSPEVNRRTDDDKTLLLATRLPPGVASARA
jgi:hypothetical protein